MNITKRIKRYRLEPADIFCNDSLLQRMLQQDADSLAKFWEMSTSTVCLSYEPENSIIACTDNIKYYLNAGHKKYEQCVLDDKIMLCFGMLFHESGHRMFTNFTALYECINSITNGVFYPSPPILKDEKDEEAYLEICDILCDRKKANLLCMIVKNLMNILEDGRIEFLLEKLEDKFSTLSEGISLLRDLTYDEMDTFSELIEKRDCGSLKSFDVFCQIMLHYARFESIKGLKGEHESDPSYMIFIKAKPYIDKAISTLKSNEFYSCIMQLLIVLWDDIKVYFSELSSKDESSSPSPLSEMSDDELDELSKSLSDAMNSLEGLTEELSKSELTSAESSKGTDEDSAKEKISKGSRKERKKEAPSSTIIKDVKEDAMEKREEKEEERILNEELKSLPDIILNDDIKSSVKFPKVTNINISKYNAVSEKYNHIAKIMVRKSDFFPKTPNPTRVHNQYCGSKFHANTVAKADFRNFSKLKPQPEKPSLAVSILIDESGSMDSRGRIEAARATALTLYEYCKQMNIPFAIYGHTADMGEDVTLYCYSDFDSSSDKNKYRLMNISAKHNNRDGYALNFAVKKIMQRPEKCKLVIIVSDGLPAARGYWNGEAELKKIASECEKKKIILLAAAIGSDKENIKKCYGEKHFLDITNLDKLPAILVSRLRNIIKRYR